VSVDVSIVGGWATEKLPEFIGFLLAERGDVVGWLVSKHPSR
jgi:hypothetical protein